MPITQKVKASYSDPEAPGKKIGDIFKGDAGSSGTSTPAPSAPAPSAPAASPSGTATTSAATPSVSSPETTSGEGTSSGDKKGLTTGQKIGIGLAAATVLPAIGAMAAHKKKKKKMQDLPSPKLS